MNYSKLPTIPTWQTREMHFRYVLLINLTKLERGKTNIKPFLNHFKVWLKIEINPYEIMYLYYRLL